MEARTAAETIVISKARENAPQGQDDDGRVCEVCLGWIYCENKNRLFG